MPSYTLHYFPIRGVGEPIELMFAYAETKLEKKVASSSLTPIAPASDQFLSVRNVADM